MEGVELNIMKTSFCEAWKLERPSIGEAPSSSAHTWGPPRDGGGSEGGGRGTPFFSPRIHRFGITKTMILKLGSSNAHLYVRHRVLPTIPGWHPNSSLSNSRDTSLGTSVFDPFLQLWLEKPYERTY